MIMVYMVAKENKWSEIVDLLTMLNTTYKKEHTIFVAIILERFLVYGYDFKSIGSELS